MKFPGWIGSLGLVLALVGPVQAEDCPGVLVAKVKEGSVAFDVGMRDGDRLHSWRFVDPEVAQGIEVSNRICSVFDMWRLTLEVSPRGSIEISGRRDGEQRSWRYDGGPRLSASWEPIFPAVMVDSWAIALPLRNIASPEADQAWQVLLDLARTQAAAPDLIWLQVERGFGLARNGHPDQGQGWFSRATDLADLQNAWIAAHIRWTQGRGKTGLTPQASTALVERARESWLSQGEVLSAAHAHEALGEIAYDLNDFDAADAHFRRSEIMRSQVAPNSLDRATSLQNMGVTASILDDLPAAIAHANQAREILGRYRAGNQLATVSSNLSALYGMAGQTERQVEVGEDALRLGREIGLSGTRLAAALVNLSTATVALGDLARGEALAQEAVVAAGQGGDRETLAAAHQGVAWIAEEQGNYEVAEAAYRQAIQIRASMIPPPPALASAQISLGMQLTRRGEFEAAGKVFEDAQQHLETQAPDHFYTVELDTGWAQLLLRQGNLPEARRRADRAVERAAVLQLDGNFATTANLTRGKVLLAQRKLSEATEQADRTLALTRRIAPATALEAQALELQGRVAVARGRWSAAAESFCLGVEILENQISRLGRAVDNDVRFRSRHLGLFEGCAEASLATGDMPAAFHVLERSRAWKTRQALAQRNLLVTGEAKGKLQARARRLANRHDELLAELSSADSAERVDEVRSQLKALSREREELLTDIRAADPRHAEVTFPRPMQASAAARLLQPRDLLVAFEVTENDTLAFTLDATGRLRGHRLGITAAALSTQVDEFLAAIETRAATPQIRELSSRLHRNLLAPLAAISTSERLIIVSDGPLLRLPWAALGALRGEGEQDWRWLIEDVAILTVPSATVYSQLLQRPRSHTERIVAFGDPTLGDAQRAVLVDGQRGIDAPPGTEAPAATGAPAATDALAGTEALRSLLDRRGALQPLPASRAEIRSIEKAYAGKSVSVFVGADASETRARQLDPRERIIHFAGHAILDEENPLESGLVLSTPRQAATGLDNGFLQAWEITDSLRLDAELVTLSACSTARGPELRGEGLQGLSLAFLHAGARSVLGTLWPVADQSTAQLMATFYRESAAGLPRDQALRRAQLEMIRGDRVAAPAVESGANRGVGGLAPAAARPVATTLSAPYYWAAFGLIGDPR